MKVKDIALNEKFPYDVDHMPGATRKDLSPKGCKTCNGHGHVYKSSDGKLRTDNPGKGSKRIVCPTCKGK
jgi:DnaJ-class molecular chaperone